MDLLLPHLRSGCHSSTSRSLTSSLKPGVYLQPPLSDLDKTQNSRAPFIARVFRVAVSIAGQAGLPVALLPSVIRDGDGDLGSICEGDGAGSEREAPAGPTLRTDSDLASTIDMGGLEKGA